jgi:hypothetical protein
VHVIAQWSFLPAAYMLADGLTALVFTLLITTTKPAATDTGIQTTQVSHGLHNRGGVQLPSPS